VGALKEFKDFRKDGNYTIGCDWARQLVAITALLNEVANSADSPADSRPTTKGDLLQAVANIKGVVMPHVTMSYATAAQGHSPAPPTRLTPPRPTSSPGTQDKEIFIAMKNASKDTPLLRVPATELTTQCSALLSAYFCDPSTGGIPMPDPLRSSSHLPNGNIVLTFKTKDDATRA